MNWCAAESEEWQKAYIKFLLCALVNIYLKCKHKIIQLEITSQVINSQMLYGDDVLIMR